MGKQISDRTRKTSGILLLVLFVSSLATSSVNVAASVKYGDKNSDIYACGYRAGYFKGYNAGFTDRVSGKDPKMFITIYYGPNSGYKGGYFNGFRDGYDVGYNAGKKL